MESWNSFFDLFGMQTFHVFHDGGHPRPKADKVIAGVAQRAQALRRLVMDVNSRKAPLVQHIFLVGRVSH